MQFKKRKKKTSGRKPNFSSRAFLIALLAFLGISIGIHILPNGFFPFSETAEQTADINTVPITGTGSTDTFQVHILDVGQGLSVLIEAGTEAFLYDGGGADTSSFVVSYLQNQDVNRLNYCIASHYDADHLSGIVGVLNQFEIETLIAPDYTYDTKTYYSFVNTVKEKNLTIHSPIPSESFPFGAGSIQILAPLGTVYEDDNDYSVVVKITLGNSSLLLTGDATSVSEAEMLTAGVDLEADVLVLGHHGSYSSTGENFFEAVSPEYSIISCGSGNDYGHPHTRIMKLLEESNSTLYRTDLQGTICFTMTAAEIAFDIAPCQDYATGDEVRYQNDTAK